MTKQIVLKIAYGDLELTRDLRAELRRRMTERGATPQALEALEGAFDETIGELDTYIASLPPLKDPA